MNPSWRDVLRRACEASSQRAVARRIGYTQAAISAVLAGTYAGSVAHVRVAVEARLMSGTVECPVMGTITRKQCLAYQARPFTPTNPAAVALYRACRSGCPHSFLKPVFAPGAQPAVAQRNNTGSSGVMKTPVVTRDTSHRVTEPTGRRKRPTAAAKQGPKK